MSEHRDPNAGNPPIKAGFEPPAAPRPADAVSTTTAPAPQVQQSPQGFFIPQDQFEQMLLRIASAIKAPSAEEQAKLDKQAARDAVVRLRATQDAIELLNVKRREQRYCQHINPDGHSRWRGQVLTNGWGKILCAWCGKAYFILADAELTRNGMGLGEPHMKNLDEARIAKWAEDSLVAAKMRNVPLPVEEHQFMPDVSELPIPTQARARA